jgi:plastocyanin
MGMGMGLHTNRRATGGFTRCLALLTLLPLPLLLLPLLLAGCGGSHASNEVDMGVAAFQQSGVSIKAGEAIHFVDPATGGTHVICVGQGLTCSPQSGAPAELNTASGITFNTGDTRDIVFPTAGTYNVVCVIHPGMEVTITVS